MSKVDLPQIKRLLGAWGESKYLREDLYSGGLERVFWTYLAFRRRFVNLVTKVASEYLGPKPDCNGLRMSTSCRSQWNVCHFLPRSLMMRTREKGVTWGGESDLKCHFLLFFSVKKVNSLLVNWGQKKKKNGGKE